MKESVFGGPRFRRVKAIEDVDGRRRMEILQRDDGLFYFEEVSEVAGDPPHYPDPYWTPTYVSGLHGSAEEAEREAHSVLKWPAKL